MCRLRERCYLCNKIVYKHQHVVVCSLDGNIFHGACLNFDRDTCFHIQSGSSGDWFCPSCSRDIFPFFDSLSDMSNVPCLCKNCRLHRNSLQLDKDTLTFNPFQIDLDSDNNNNNIFDDSMSNVLSTAYNILNSCNYHSIQAISQQDIGSSLSTFYFHNIDGYKTNFHESLINIKSMNNLPSVIAFCETNLKLDDQYDYDITEYNTEHLYAINDKNKGSGLSFYYKKSHVFFRLASLDIRNKLFECMGGRLLTETYELYIIIIYRYHGNESEFINGFTKIISDYKDKPLLIMGDFNIDLMCYDSNTNVDKFVNTMMSNSLFPLINRPTNFFRNTSTLIDHSWSNVLHECTRASIIDSSVSTHKPIFTVLPASLKQLEHQIDDSTRNILIHNVNHDTLRSFSNDLEDITSFDYDSGYITDSHKIKSVFSEFYSKLTNIYSKHISVKKELSSKRNKFDKPWISIGLAKSCKTKNKLHNAWIKSRGTNSESFHKAEYKSYRNKLRKLIRISETNYYKFKFTRTCDDIKKAWSVINSIRCKKKSSKFPSFLDINGLIISNRRIMCSEFNNYFTNVASNLNK